MNRIHVGVLTLLILVAGCQDKAGMKDGHYRCPDCNLLLMVIDTLRIDHLGPRDGRTSVTPGMDRLAARSLVFERAYSPSSWTRSACASILTGLLPVQHHIYSENRKEVLSSEAHTIQKFFKSLGYSTGAFLTNLHYKYGLSRDFDHTFYRSNEYAQRTSAQALEWITRNQKGKWFALIHYNDPHETYDYHKGFSTRRGSPYRTLKPYLPILQKGQGYDCDNPGPIVKLESDPLAEMMANYDGEIAYLDHHLGKLLESLRLLGLERNTVVVLTADHGEEFLDHGSYWHGCTLYDELIRVPLIMHLPGLPARSFNQMVSTIDIFPTLMDAFAPDRLGSAGLAGQSLLPLAAGAPWEERPVMASTAFRGKRKHAFIKDGRKIIRRAPGEVLGLYDLKKDAQEQSDLSGDSALGDRLSGELQALMDSLGKLERKAEPAVVLGEEEREQLRSLGYVE